LEDGMLETKCWEMEIKSNQINIRLIRWQITTTDTDAKVIYNNYYIDTMLVEGTLNDER